MEGVKRALRWSLLPIGLYLLAALLLFLFVGILGVAVGQKQQEIAKAIDGSPAQVAGLQSGDVLLTIDGAIADLDHPVRELIARAGGRPVRVGIRRAGNIQEVSVQPRDGLIGVQLQPVVTCDRLPFMEAAGASFSRPIQSAWMLMRRPPHADVAGPIAIAKMNISPCARRYGLALWGSMILVISSVVSLPVAIVMGIRGRKSTSSSRSSQ